LSIRCNECPKSHHFLGSTNILYVNFQQAKNHFSSQVFIQSPIHLINQITIFVGQISV
jgi:hypothetical protein